MQYQYNDLGFLSKDNIVRFKLEGNNLKVMLLTYNHYHLFKSGYPYRFFGGYANQEEEHITIPFDSEWVAVIALHEYLISHGKGTIEIVPAKIKEDKTSLPEEAQMNIGTSLDEDVESSGSINKLVDTYKEFVAFERSTRKLISEVLSKKIEHDNWWICCIGSTIRTIAEDRKTKDSEVEWHSERGSQMMDYLDFMHLSDIIRSSKNWKYFEPIFKDKWFVENHFQKLNPSRNALMHAGNLSDTDLTRIELNMHDWYALVEKFKTDSEE